MDKEMFDKMKDILNLSKDSREARACLSYLFSGWQAPPDEIIDTKELFESLADWIDGHKENCSPVKMILCLISMGSYIAYTHFENEETVNEFFSFGIPLGKLRAKEFLREFKDDI